MPLQDILVPDIGGYKNVSVIEINVAVGDVIAAEHPLMTLETDKATMDIPSPVAGTVKELLVQMGSKVSQGSLVLRVQIEGAEVAATPAGKTESSQASANAPVKAAVQVAHSAEESADIGDPSLYASPAVRRLARELGLNLAQLIGTGRKGRITKEDLKSGIQRLVQGGGSAMPSNFKVADDPEVDFAEFGPVQTVELMRIKKLSSAALHRNWVRIPHITFFEKSDITGLESFRQEHKATAEKKGIKLTPLAFIIKAVSNALLDFPNMNASLAADGQSLVLKKYIHIGFAVDTPQGLMVPVIRDVDQKGLMQIAQEIAELSKKCKDGSIKGKEMQGGCFTISSIGNLGTLGFTPIINMPELGILGVSKAVMEPWYDGKGFVPRLMLPLSLSVDHRVIDGAEGAQFIVTIAKLLSDIRQLIM